ncbi:Na+/H+ antiporter NhaC [Umboniibacter marinipuniceus]|uniref:Transporter (NhaC family) n=1 Tax=Umboniibacter marinipuniceus TaxID=569599 RepID=A0A3M0AJY3_9GAMM|nr:Na+/H+ antiporter NhaC [Umboniibacter marinipuniceus]RMA79362.1 transporter (NhaC family) [Umboniibacter marinipuniceus]
MSTVKSPSYLQSLIPVISLILMLSASVYLYGADSSYGANQIALLLCAAITGLIGIYNGMSWESFEEGMLKGISLAFGSVMILLAVGALIGTWILSGTVPAMIYYGVQILDPSIFYFAACLICALVSVSIGSSWTTAGTLGIGLIGIAEALQLDPAITAGAIISGAYFGDKLSPLSETTNLASAITGVNLFDHIRHMLWTTVPAYVVALVFFAFLGFGNDAQITPVEITALVSAIQVEFNISLISLLPLVFLLFLAYKKVPAFPTILLGALFGAIMAAVLQPQAVEKLAGEVGDLGVVALHLKGIWTTLFDGYTSDSNNEMLGSLLSKGGMSSMLNTVWLIVCAMAFGGAIEKVGILEKLVGGALSMVHSTGSLITTTIVTAFAANVVTSDQYMAIVLPGRMYRLEFERRGLNALNLSRSLEDAGTITSPLIPWNTCGAYMAATLGIATWTYAPWALFNIICPFIGIAYGLLNIKLAKNETQAAA